MGPKGPMRLGNPRVRVWGVLGQPPALASPLAAGPTGSLVGGKLSPTPYIRPPWRRV
jgi:hypothetical protein